MLLWILYFFLSSYLECILLLFDLLLSSVSFPYSISIPLSNHKATSLAMLPKPRVLALIAPKASSVEVLAKYDSIYHLDTLTVQDRAEAIPALAKAAALNGPYVGFIVLMGTHAFGHFDAEFLSPLLPGLKIVVSASAGYNKFDVEWMTRNDIWFCNTRNAVSEPTADMALWLILGIVRDTTRAEKSLREGRWRADLVPSRDPAGMKLGILGLGAIGKVSRDLSSGDLQLVTD